MISISIAMSISMVTISKVSISMASISMGTITTIVSISIGISISTTLATGNMLEGVSSWVKLVNSVNSSIVRKTKRNSITIKSITGFSISTTLAKSLGRSSNEGGSGTGMSGNTKTMSIKTITISPGITIAIGQVSWLGIGFSATLAVVEGRTATKTGGGRVRGGHSWPVRVGIE